ncbi:hypothetical protein RERY_04400 [Rhodococcus erythropolis]|nr:DUF4192 family protein [Rhodococcus erythropolis]OFV78893.1 hypothetical protein RERY_04400 [Rhodococcus erythropolis]
MQNIRLRTATDVLAAIPALLGFVPANSVVMIALTGSPATFAFVARTDVIGSGPAAAPGLDQIEASEREFDSMGIRSIRTLVAESRSERGGSTPTARCLTSNACSPSHAISCSVVGSLRPLGRASSFRPCWPAESGTPPKALSEMSSPSGTPQPRAFSAARAALNPPIPWTPPPGGVADEQRYTPGAPVA